MSCRSAILIDNFLDQSKFDNLSAKVAASSAYNTTTVQDLRDDLFTEAYTAVFQRLNEIGSVSYTHLTLPTNREV